MALDHGILNVPIDKRGGGTIDAQIDRWKATQARDKRVAAKEAAARLKTDRETAKRLVDGMSADMLARIAAKAGVSASVARRTLKSDAHFQPALIIRAMQAEGSTNA